MRSASIRTTPGVIDAEIDVNASLRFIAERTSRDTGVVVTAAAALELTVLSGGNFGCALSAIPAARPNEIRIATPIMSRYFAFCRSWSYIDISVRSVWLDIPIKKVTEGRKENQGRRCWRPPGSDQPRLRRFRASPLIHRIIPEKSLGVKLFQPIVASNMKQAHPWATLL